jgi:hypothetical protein
MQPRSATRTRSAPITGKQVRAAMLGRPVDGVRVVRQAHRLSDADSDELSLVDARGTWWVARRVSGELTTWLYAGDLEAEAGFDQMLALDARRGRPWSESVPLEVDRLDEAV